MDDKRNYYEGGFEPNDDVINGMFISVEQFDDAVIKAMDESAKDCEDMNPMTTFIHVTSGTLFACKLRRILFPDAEDEIED